MVHWGGTATINLIVPASCVNDGTWSQVLILGPLVDDVGGRVVGD